MRWKRLSKGENYQLSEERRTLAERYTIDAAEARRREQLLAEAAPGTDKQVRHTSPAKVTCADVTEPQLQGVHVPFRGPGEASQDDAGSPRLSAARYALFSVQSRLLMQLGFTALAAACYSSNWHSPVRVAVTVAFLLFLPGLALAHLVPLTSAIERLVVAIGASLALEALVAIAFLYSGVFTPGRVFAVLLVATAGFAAIAALQARRPS